MFDEFLDSVAEFAAKSFSAVNALHFGVMKKMGVMQEATTTYSEIIGSQEEFNYRLDTDHNVQFQAFLESQVKLDGFLDPKNTEHFLKWHFVEGSYVTLPGLAENAEITNGRLIIKAFDTVEYSFEFIGQDGTPYIYRGEKKFSIFNPIGSWKSIRGAVYHKDSGEQVLESIAFIGNGDIGESIRQFFSSFRII